MAVIGKAIDYSGARPDLAQVKAFGYTDVYRYTRSKDSPYRLGPTERDQILDAGLDIGIHGEDSAGDAAYGATRGKLRGTAWADWMRDGLDAPKGMTIVAAIDYDTGGQYPNAVDDYLAAVEAAFQGEYRLGVYGSYGVITGAHAAGRGGACYVMTNAWGPDTPPTFCHLHQHGGTPFPSTDHNDILRNPRGTWLQTLGGDMPLTADDVNLIWDEPIVNTLVDNGLPEAARTRLLKAQAYANQAQANAAQAQASVSTLTAAVTQLAATLTAAVTQLAAKVTDLQDAVAQLQPGGPVGGPATVSLTGTLTPS